jgi:hypothetical protein
MTFPEIKDVLEALSYAATIIGIPVAICVFLIEKRKDRRQAEMDAFREADARYVSYLTLCLEHPDLKGFDPCCYSEGATKSGLNAQALTLFTVLVAMLESSYILYRDQRPAIRAKQWQGWHDYMVDWARRPEFRRAWPIVLRSQFDTDFVQYMDKIMRDAEPSELAAGDKAAGSESQ